MNQGKPNEEAVLHDPGCRACNRVVLPDLPWDPTFLNPPLQIILPDPSHTMVQREALGLDQTNGNIFITSEKALAPIYVVEPLSTH